MSWFSHVWSGISLGLHMPLPRYKMEQQMRHPRLRGVTLRQYQPADYEVCREICDLNAPGRFPSDTAEDHERYLKEVPVRNLVAEVNGRVIGCGGYDLSHPNHAMFVYGLVHPDYQQIGIGRLLFFGRLAQMPLLEVESAVQIATVPRSLPYYQKFGFQLLEEPWLDSLDNPHPRAIVGVNAHLIRRAKEYLQTVGVSCPDLTHLPPTEAALLLPS